MTDDVDHDDTGALRPIRALARGLETLEALNARGPASVTEIARAVGLPRTTAYRVLETLCADGYAERTSEDRYRLLARVHRLADGVNVPLWLEKIVKPATASLGELTWPLLFATREGIEMRAHALGPEPRVPERLSMTSAAGLAYLATCDSAERASIVTLLGQSTTEIAARVEETAQRGAATSDDGSALMLAVPVSVRTAPAGALVLMIPRDALADQAVDRFTALLAAAATEIAAAWETTLSS